MGGPPTDRCGYTWPEDYEVGDSPKHQSCCWRETADGSDRCIWHADSDEVSKTVEALQEARAPHEIREQNLPPNARNRNSPPSELLDGSNLSNVEIGDQISFQEVSLRDSDLSRADFEEADLLGVDLSGSTLLGANLSEAFLAVADLSDAYLTQTNFSGAHFLNANLSWSGFYRADLSDADLRDARLTNAYLRETDLSGANLGGTDLTGVDLRKATIADISINGKTTCKYLYEGNDERHPTIRRNPLPEEPTFGPEAWDATARAYHDLKSVFSDHGLVGKARHMHVRERRARSLEAKAAGGFFDSRYLGTFPSRYITGYGFRAGYLLIWMHLLFLIPTAIYIHAGVEDTIIKNVSYSVLTFTVAPPEIPEEPWVQAIMMVQTFFGKISIILLGYILRRKLF